MKTLNSIIYLLSIILAINFVGCNKNIDNEPNIPDNVDNMDDLVADPNFTFDASKEIVATVKTVDNLGNPLSGARVELLVGDNYATAHKVVSGNTDENGIFNTRFSLRDYWDSIFVDTRHIGVPSGLSYLLSSNEFNIIVGQGMSTKSVMKNGTATMYDPAFGYLGTFSTPYGVPDYLMPQNDPISSAFLNDIDNALPEQAPVPDYHPEYLASSMETNTVLTEAADVWVTFVHEGAGYKNVLGFYTYDEDNIPFVEDQIDSIQIIYPNVSYTGSGGGLVSGNKVHIGTFQAGTIIGWTLIANGWNTAGYIRTDKPRYYSIDELNPEATATLRQHNVLLHDPVRELFIIGFEDLNRGQWTDDDFNDAIFYVTTNPVDAADYGNTPSMYPDPEDMDGDGVSDYSDDYPNDDNRAFDNYYPGEDETGSLAFEDLWPKKGDYDFNDMVVDYNINQIANADNEIVAIEATFVVKAVGAGYKNGFGIQLPVSSSLIASVTGYNVPGNVVTLSTNGSEAGQSLATIIAFENVYDIFPNVSSGYVNTRENDPYINPETISVTITFNQPVSINDLGIPPYNPFIIVNLERGKEVHLPNYGPTDLATLSYFGTHDDDSDFSQGKYYRDISNLPWAMHIPKSFDYPIEKASILQGHTVFDNWVLSNGFSYMDWYLDKPSYRNPDFIYSVSK